MEWDYSIAEQSVVEFWTLDCLKLKLMSWYRASIDNMRPQATELG